MYLIIQLSKIFENKKIMAIFHAAAYKHWITETNEKFVFKNNASIFNLNDLLQALKFKFINISTDKAVKSTNIMGLTNFAEISSDITNIAKWMHIFSVRFGNV